MRLQITKLVAEQPNLIINFNEFPNLNVNTPHQIENIHILFGSTVICHFVRASLRLLIMLCKLYNGMLEKFSKQVFPFTFFMQIIFCLIDFLQMNIFFFQLKEKTQLFRQCAKL